MEEIKIKILENGRAREVNPLGDEPSPYFSNKKNKWQQAEDNLREFDIVNRGETIDGKLELYFSGLGGTEKMKLVEIGSIHTARVEGNKCIII